MSWKYVQRNDATGAYRTTDQGGGGGGSSTLAGLEDVNLTNLLNGQILKWDEVAEKFVNTNNLADALKYFKIIPIAPDYSASARYITFANLSNYSSIQGFVFCRYGIGYVQGWRENGNATIKANSTFFGTTASYSVIDNTKIRANIPQHNTMVFLGTVFGSVEILI